MSMHHGRILAGGLLAGLVINLGELFMNVWLLGDRWIAALGDVGLEISWPAAAFWGVGGFVAGVVGIWLYAAIRPRYGVGAGSSLRAGAAIWCLVFLYPSIGFLGSGPFPRSLILIALGWGFVEIMLAMALGSYFYADRHLAPN